jgi:hypothetical protein
MKFDCLSGALCVKTDWRILSFRSSGSSGGGGGGGVVIPPVATDVCPNISGIQIDLPQGYVFDLSGRCIQTSDVCPNISGVQTEVPEGYRFFKNECVEIPEDFDYCPNIFGVQTSFASCPSENIQPIYNNQPGRTPSNLPQSIKNQFDTNNDGEPDFFPNPEVMELLEDGIFKQVFPKNEALYSKRESCFFCILIRRDVFFDAIQKEVVERKIVKWAFVPQKAEVPALIASASQSERNDLPVQKNLDLTSAIISGFLLLGLRKFALNIIARSLKE